MSPINNVEIRIIGTKKDPILKTTFPDDSSEVISRRSASLYDQAQSPQSEVNSTALRDRTIAYRLVIRLKVGEPQLIRTGQFVQVIGYMHPQLHRMVACPKPYTQYVIMSMDITHSGDTVVTLGLVRKDNV